MGDRTTIEWTRGDDGSPGATWNPVAGCSRVSEGCQNCYAERQVATRLSKVPAYAGLATSDGWTGELRYLPERLDQPSRWRRPRRIFVNSMSDLFHPDVLKLEGASGMPALVEIVAEMVANPRHTFQVLTKRPKLMAAVLSEPRFALDVNATLLRRGVQVMPGGMSQPFDMWGRQRHIWWGTSIEDQRYAFRARHLLETPAAVRFISAEPLLGPLDLSGHLAMRVNGGRLGWVIAGGESGPGARPIHPGWARSLRDQCQAAGVPFLFKQWGEFSPAPRDFFPPTTHTFEDGTVMAKLGKHAAGRTLDGRTWDEYP